MRRYWIEPRERMGRRVLRKAINLESGSCRWEMFHQEYAEVNMRDMPRRGVKIARKVEVEKIMVDGLGAAGRKHNLYLQA